MPIVPTVDTTSDSNLKNINPSPVMDQPQATSEPTPAPPVQVQPKQMDTSLDEPMFNKHELDPHGVIPDDPNDSVRLNLAHEESLSKSPDQAAKVLALEMKTGVPGKFIEENMDYIEKESQRNDFDADTFRQNNPRLSAWVASNPNHYAIAKDDMDNAKAIEEFMNEYGLMNSAYDALGAGLAKFNSTVAKVPAFTYDLAALPVNAVGKVVGADPIRAPESWYNNPVSKYYDEQAQIFTDKNSDLNKSIVAEAAKGNYAKAGRVAFASVVMNAPNQFALMAGAMTGFGGIALLGAGLTQAADTASRPENQKADPTLSTINAAAQGAVESGFESIGTFGILKQWEHALSKEVGKQGAKEVIKNFAKTMAYSIAGEGNEEALTSIAQDLIDNSTGLGDKSLADIMTSSIDAGLIGAFSGGTTTALGGIASSSKQMKDIRQATMNKDMYLAMGDTIEASKIKARLPEKYREMIENVTKDGPIENVYVDPKAFTEYFQAYDGGVAKQVQDLGIEDEYERAIETGEMIRVPTATWANKIAGTEHYSKLANDITFDPEKLTLNEAKQASEEAKTASSQTPSEESQMTLTVEKQILDQLKSANAPGNLENQAKVFATINERMARDNGLNPQEFFNKYGLQVARPLPNQLQDKNINSLDPMIDQFRSGNLVKEQDARGPSLGSFIKNSGGIKLDGVFDGEVKSSAKKLIKKDGKGLDQLREAAVEAGYLQEGSTVDDLLQLLDKESKGSPVYSPSNEKSKMFEEYTQQQEFKRYLDSIGADLSTMDNSQVKRLLEAGVVKQSLEDEFFLQMAGRKAATANTIALSKAAQMKTDGVDMESIRKETGWFLGPDNRWRFEVSDEKAEFKPINLKKKKSYKLSEILDHKELYKAYPDIANINIEFKAFRGRNLGSWDKKSNTIEIAVEKITDPNSALVKKLEEIKSSPEYKAYLSSTGHEAGVAFEKFTSTELGKEFLALSRTSNKIPTVWPSAIPDGVMDTVLHEIQHAIQFTEGFAPGANSRADGKYGYKNSLGEVEARDVESRKNLTGQERANKAPATQNWKNPVIKWGSVSAELPIEEIPKETVNTIIGEQMSLFQGASNPLGKLSFSGERKMNISLYEKANASTFMHEQAHYWLEVIGDIAESADGSERTKGMYAEILKYLGVENRSEIKTEHHEKFAESFEKYLMEGKAPTRALQSVFNSFKAWLEFVYKSLLNLDVKLSPDIRKVFDRMLATDEEIEQAQLEFNPNPLIYDPIAAGLTPEQVAKYTDLVEEAKQEASNILTVQMMKQIQRERSKAWKEELKQVTAQVTEQVDSQEDQVLLKMLKSGKMEGRGDLRIKLDRASVEEAYGKEFVQKLPTGIFGKDGMSHDVLGSLLGFESGWQMIEMLANVQDRNDLIEQMVNDEMVSRHGAEDIAINGELEEKARQAVHNDKQAQLKKMQLDFLFQMKTKGAKDMIKSLSKRNPPIASIKLKAEAMIGNTVVTNIKPYVYSRSERKYANETIKKFLSGDIDGAIESKKKEILNHELYRAAIAARDTIAKQYKSFDAFFKADEKIAKNRDMNLITAGRAILSGFGYGKDTRDPTQVLSQMKAYDPEGYDLLKDSIDSALENADYFKNLTYDQQTALYDRLDAIWEKSKYDKLIEVAGKMVDIETVRASLLEAVAKLPTVRGADKYDTTESADSKAMALFETYKARVTRMEFKIEAMDAYGLGAFRSYIYQSVRNATEIYRSKKGGVMIKLNQLLQDNKASFGGKEIIAESLQFRFKNKGELIGALLHTGNDSNFRRLLLGNEWATLNENKNLDTTRWDQFIKECWNNGTLTKSDYDLVQSIWDTVDSFKADTQKAFKQMNGYYFSEIQSKEIVTPFGKYKGGYVPATPDRARSRDPQIRNEKAQIEGDFMGELPSKNDSFTKQRVENYATPLIMDLSLVTSHIDNALRFTYITPRVKEVVRLLHNREVRSSLDAYDNKFVSHVAIPFLVRASTQSTSVATENKQLDAFLSYAKNNSAIKLMFMNIPNTVQQIANYIPATLKVGPGYLLNAVKQVTMNNKSVTEAIAEKSLFMRNKLETLSEKSAMEIENVLKDRNALQSSSVWIQKNAYIAQSYLQNIMDSHVWLASYDQAIAEGNGEVDAVNIADSNVRQTQSSYAPEDTSAIETQNPLMKSLMMFFGFFNNMSNFYAAEWSKAGTLDTGKRALKKSSIIANYFLFAFAGKLIIDAVKGRIGDDDDDKESLAFWTKYSMGSAFELTAPMLGVAGNLAQVGYKQITGDASYGNRVSVSPLLSGTEQLITGLAKINKEGGSEKTKVKNIMTLIGYSPLISFVPAPKVLPVGVKNAWYGMKDMSGYSAVIGSLKRPVGYAVGVSEGKDKANTPLDVTQGVLSGYKK